MTITAIAIRQQNSKRDEQRKVALLLYWPCICGRGGGGGRLGARRLRRLHRLRRRRKHARKLARSLLRLRRRGLRLNGHLRRLRVRHRICAHDRRTEHACKLTHAALRGSRFGRFRKRIFISGMRGGSGRRLLRGLEKFREFARLGRLGLWLRRRGTRRSLKHPCKLAGLLSHRGRLLRGRWRRRWTR